MEKKIILTAVIRGALALTFLAVAAFTAAGRLDYWQGWSILGLTVAGLLIAALVFKNKPELIQERMKPGPGTKWWDWIFYALYIPAFYALVIVAGLDAGRFCWTKNLPAPVYCISYMLFFLSLGLFLWAMSINKFFSGTVRIQEDRGHAVIQNGPYRFVRHPGYMSGMLLFPSMALMLGSLWALIPAGIVLLLLVGRTYLEDSALQRELEGYKEYAQKVRHRLFPGAW